MKIKLTFLAILMAILPGFAASADMTQLEVASTLLKAENASYIAKTTPSGLKVITFMYVDPKKTCLLLQNNGINIISVINHAKDVNNPDKLVKTAHKC